jgi:methyltransferase (TIGR00027 family)
MHRAAHQLLDRPPVFPDPFALRIVGAEAEADLRSGRDWHGYAAAGLRAFIAARSRFAEDSFAAAIARGVDQYVLLGAGLDTFAYRAGADFPDIHVLEIDHPATQSWKRARLKEAGIVEPANLTFAPVNFEYETLAEGLARTSCDAARPVFFAWLGVTPYLSRDAIFATLEFVATANSPGSEIVFDYAEPVTDAARRAGFDAMAARVAAAGEPFRSFFKPALLADELRRIGFSDIEDLDATALNRRYFVGRADGLKIAGGGHVLRARV